MGYESPITLISNHLTLLAHHKLWDG